MKFNLEETVTGADLRPGAVLLVFPREQLTEVLQSLGPDLTAVDSFVVDRQRVTMAVYPSPPPTLPPDQPPQFGSDAPRPGDRARPFEGESFSFARLKKDGVVVEEGYFRLTLKGHRLTEGKGLAALWESVLADETIPLRLSCSDCNGITQYLPDSARNAVLDLLNRTFGIRVV